MEKKHRDVLKEYRMEIVRDLDVDKATSFLYSKSILSENDRDKIKAIKTLESKSEELLDMLPSRGPDAFGFFVEFLDKNQSFWVMDSEYSSLGLANTDSIVAYCVTKAADYFQIVVIKGTKQPVDNVDAPARDLDDEKSPKETDEELKHENSQNTFGKTTSSSTQEDGKCSKLIPKPNEGN
ncbi:death domain-containing protein CRADD-like [Xenia sp. Carnegie-2017]|uniref:death domain-containing protein CRADD-like n=1 Tax=Xenia sp. Carnegie-2017 TaxID=2897299 RepID=UPI001F041979|nr:death domain-containing protein CRADD-like [Xenia sp. Carnegie-2017]